MESTVAAASFQHLRKPICPQSPSSSRTLASSTPSKRRKSQDAGRIMYRCKSSDSAMFGTQLTKILRSRSCELPKSRRQSMKPSCSAGFRSFSDDECSKLFQESSSRQTSKLVNVMPDPVADSRDWFGLNTAETKLHLFEEDGNFAGSIEHKANDVGLPISVRMIKRKLQRQQRISREAEVLEDSSIKSAFSSMVLIIRELQSCTLQMKQFSSEEDLQGMLVHVRQETHASFVWLFERVFSRTPTLMVDLMILVANFSAHSVGVNAAMATSSFTQPASAFVIESDGVVGEDRLIGSTRKVEITPYDFSGEEASSMQESIRNEALGLESVPKHAEKIKSDDYAEYLKTEALYQIGLSKEPNNQLLLTNFAQFLYLIARDFDRAEDYFKRAVAVEPGDAEALRKYANFLWRVRNDLWAAEETFLEAISTDPANPFYHADYASFLFSTGADDTCFPLSSSHQQDEEEEEQEEEEDQ